MHIRALENHKVTGQRQLQSPDITVVGVGQPSFRNQLCDEDTSLLYFPAFSFPTLLRSLVPTLPLWVSNQQVRAVEFVSRCNRLTKCL